MSLQFQPPTCSQVGPPVGLYGVVVGDEGRVGAELGGGVGSRRRDRSSQKRKVSSKGPKCTAARMCDQRVRQQVVMRLTCSGFLGRTDDVVSCRQRVMGAPPSGASERYAPDAPMLARDGLSPAGAGLRQSNPHRCMCRMRNYSVEAAELLP